MIPLPAPKPKPIEPEFWALVRAFAQAKVDIPSPAALRAFVELGRIEGLLESANLRRQLKELRSRLAYYIRKSRSREQERKRHSNRRNAVWDSKRFCGNGPGTIQRLSDAVIEAERKQILLTLQSGLSVKEAAAKLGISVSTLYRRIPKASKAIT